METFINGTLVLLPILYTLLVIAYARVFLGRKNSLLARRARLLLGGTAGLHTFSVVARGFQVGQCPVGSSGEAFSVVALTIVIIYFFIEWRSGDQSTGVFVVSAALPLELIASVSLLEAPAPVTGEPMGSFVSLHAFAALVGLSAIAVAAAYGCLYLFLYWCIKKGRFGLFFNLVAPLETLADLNYRAVRAAFAALTVSVGLGVWSAFRGDHAGLFLDPQVLLSTCLWGLYGGCVISKRWLHVGGKRLALATVFGVPLVVAIGLVTWLQRGFHG